MTQELTLPQRMRNEAQNSQMIDQHYLDAGNLLNAGADCIEELLEALTAVSQWAERQSRAWPIARVHPARHGGRHAWSIWDDPVFEKANAAIAKARGRTP